jgi:CRISPR-associated protein Csx10
VIPGDQQPQAWLLNLFRQQWLQGSAEGLAAPAPAKKLETPRAPEGQSVRVRVIAYAGEPLLIAQRASAGNQFETQMTVTGKTLRGALAAQAASTFDLSDEATYRAFADLFLRGSVRFPTLLPMQLEVDDGDGGKMKLYPAIPVPGDGFACKVHSSHPIQWATRPEEGKDAPDRTCLAPVTGKEKGCGKPVKAVRGKFLPLRAGEKPFTPQQRDEMHIRIDHETGRVAHGQVFEYIPLEAGQYFAGEMICTDANAWQVLQAFVGLEAQGEGSKVVPIRLGKGRQRGYGQVMLWLKEIQGTPPLWIGRPLEGADGKPGRLANGERGFTLTLLTDAIVVDTWGRFATGFDPAWLAEVLSDEAKKIAAEDVEIVGQRAYAATRLVDGFNSVQRLPRWRDVALAAGSTVRLRVNGLTDEEMLSRLKAIEENGIGLRRNEGYGQVAIDHPVYGDFEGLANVSLEVTDLPDALQIGGPLDSARGGFLKWVQDLATQPWDRCAGSAAIKGAFAALARWLVAYQEEPPDDLTKVLDTLLASNEVTPANVPTALAGVLPGPGEPDRRLAKEIIEAYGTRDKANKLHEAPNGVKLIRDALRELSGQPKWQPFWAEGVAAIAAQVAAVTKTKEEA